MAKTLEQRFWDKIDKSSGHGPDGECWKWTAAVDSNGYGAFSFNGKKRNSHRIAYELVNGPINRNMDIRHSCDFRLCCRDSHLSPGSRLQNVKDSVGRNRHTKGIDIGVGKCPEALVLAIRALHKNGCSEAWIYKSLKIGRRTVRDILSGKTWNHIQLEEYTTEAEKTSA